MVQFFLIAQLQFQIQKINPLFSLVKLYNLFHRLQLVSDAAVPCKKIILIAGDNKSILKLVLKENFLVIPFSIIFAQRENNWTAKRWSFVFKDRNVLAAAQHYSNNLFETDEICNKSYSSVSRMNRFGFAKTSFLSSEYCNPFRYKTSFSLYLPGRLKIKVKLFFHHYRFFRVSLSRIPE